jgi:DNA repair protein RecO (recombination protein O)
MEGIIYRVQPYQEHGRLLFCYTPKGKLTLLAQGSQKVNHPSRILSQTLTRISFKEGHKSFLTLQEGKILDDYQHLKNDFKTMKLASAIFEIIEHIVIDREDHEKIYDEIKEVLNQQDIELSVYSFSLKILKRLGYALNLRPDGRKIKGVNIEIGGLIYENDSDIVDLEIKDALELLKLYVKPYQELEDLDLETRLKMKHFILKYYRYHLQTTLKNLQ